MVLDHLAGRLSLSPLHLSVSCWIPILHQHPHTHFTWSNYITLTNYLPLSSEFRQCAMLYICLFFPCISAAVRLSFTHSPSLVFAISQYCIFFHFPPSPVWAVAFSTICCFKYSLSTTISTFSLLLSLSRQPGPIFLNRVSLCMLFMPFCSGKVTLSLSLSTTLGLSLTSHSYLDDNVCAPVWFSELLRCLFYYLMLHTEKITFETSDF